MSELTLLDIVRRVIPPVPRAEGECIPWNDPDFSARMLAVHLSQESDLASRRYAIIDAHVEWLDADILGRRSSRVLDLGCGPGLYLHRLARRGHTGVGVDFGPASLAHARECAHRDGLELDFIEADLRSAQWGGGFDLVTFIYGQLNVFSRKDATALLEKAHRALRPGGRIVVEAQTFESVRGSGEAQSSWTTSEAGLFSASPHVTLYERTWHETERCNTERWFVIDATTGIVSRYAQTTEAYSSSELAKMFQAAGFAQVEILPKMPGSPEGGALCCVLAKA